MPVAGACGLMGFAEDFAAGLASAGIPQWVVVALIALLPFIEMRGAAPVAYLLFHWPLWAALAFTGIISLVPGLVIALYMDRLEPYLRKVKLFDRLLDKAFAWTRGRGDKTADEQKARDRRATILLALLVAIPGPGTGAWTGGLVSYVFKVPKRRAVGALLLGVVGEAVAIGAILVFLGYWL